MPTEVVGSFFLVREICLFADVFVADISLGILLLTFVSQEKFLVSLFFADDLVFAFLGG